MISAAIANNGNPDIGKLIYTQCQGCHSPEWHRTGPKHCDLFGRRAGTSKGFEYSQAMKQSEVIWNKHTLDLFLQAPFSYIKGTSMGFAGVKDDNDRHNLIAYLATLNLDSGLCRP